MKLEDAPRLHVRHTRRIKTKLGGELVSDSETKEYKVLFKKRLRTLIPCLMDMNNLFIRDKYK